jgi:hypothetical protein
MEIQSHSIWRSCYEVFTRELLAILDIPQDRIITKDELRNLFSSLASDKNLLVNVRGKKRETFSRPLQVHNVNMEYVVAYDPRHIKYYRIPYTDITALKINKNFKTFSGNQVYEVQN